MTITAEKKAFYKRSFKLSLKRAIEELDEAMLWHSQGLHEIETMDALDKIKEQLEEILAKTTHSKRNLTMTIASDILKIYEDISYASALDLAEQQSVKKDYGLEDGGGTTFCFHDGSKIKARFPMMEIK